MVLLSVEIKRVALVFQQKDIKPFAKLLNKKKLSDYIIYLIDLTKFFEVLTSLQRKEYEKNHVISKRLMHRLYRKLDKQ